METPTYNRNQKELLAYTFVCNKNFNVYVHL